MRQQHPRPLTGRPLPTTAPLPPPPHCPADMLEAMQHSVVAMPPDLKDMHGWVGGLVGWAGWLGVRGRVGGTAGQLGSEGGWRMPGRQRGPPFHQRRRAGACWRCRGDWPRCRRTPTTRWQTSCRCRRVAGLLASCWLLDGRRAAPAAGDAFSATMSPPGLLATPQEALDAIDAERWVSATAMLRCVRGVASCRQAQLRAPAPHPCALSIYLSRAAGSPRADLLPAAPPRWRRARTRATRWAGWG